MNFSGKRVVLVVEDDVNTLGMLARLFDSMGFEVRVAQSAEDAIPKITDDLDLLFTDYDLPIMSGVDLADILEKKFPDVPVVILTGFSHVPLEKHVSHCHRIIKKPARPSVIRDAVLAYLS